jgi:hypothetical protein
MIFTVDWNSVTVSWFPVSLEPSDYRIRARNLGRRQDLRQSLMAYSSLASVNFN